MTTFRELIGETRGHLMTEKPDRLNLLGDDYVAGSASLVLGQTVIGIAAGSRIVVDLEVFLVLADPPSNSPGTTISVRGGMDGSIPANHAENALVYMNPNFSDYRIAQQLNHCIVALDSHGLYQIKNKLITFNPSIAGYDLDVSPNEFIDIWRVSYSTPGPDLAWPVLQTRDYYVDSSADTGDFASGVQFRTRVGITPGQQFKVSYKASYSPLVNLTDDVETVAGLHRSAHEIPPLGAAMRILSGAEVKRTFLTLQPEPRRQEEVPPGSMRQSMVPIVTAYYEAIDRELMYLHRKYPMQF